MEERKEIVNKYVARGLKTSVALSVAAIPRSTYYYQAKGGHQGKVPAAFVFKNGEAVPVQVMIDELEAALSEEFNDYGYHRATDHLRDLGYHVNPKRVYLIMKQKQWLLKAHKAKPKDKVYVKYTVPLPEEPLKIIESDFKYIYIHGLSRNAYFVSLMDTFTRVSLEWDLNLDMKKERAIGLLNQLVDRYKVSADLISKIVIRTDNGSQFIANAFREHLKESGIQHEFIQPATPQQNAHIESFHSVLEKTVCKKYTFNTLSEARAIIGRFIEYYNNKRIISKLLKKPPRTFWELWKQGKVVIETKNNKHKYFFKKEPIDPISPPLKH
jgi:putative transposase